MKVLIVGSGGREHALAWQVAQFQHQVFVAPGNGGTALESKLKNVPIAATDLDALVEFAQEHKIDITIVGPEAPLAAGIVDRFRAAKLPIFGPTQAAARLESSKSFSKDFMLRHNIPTADYRSFTEADAAKAYIREQTIPIVIKADGLAGGKGVVVAQTQAEALQAVDDLLLGKLASGQRIVVEAFLSGIEASFIVMTDGQAILAMATSQDHKTRDDHDQGPNTGGMGAYSPAPVVTPALHDQIMREIIEPTINGMKADGIEYTGFLYAGIMITAEGPKVLEYNCRFGDPETQPIMLRLKTDLAQLCLAAANYNLAQETADWDPRFALGVVMASRNYPEDYPTGAVIMGLDQIDTAQIFHAGTQLVDGKVLTNGGRILCVTSLGNSVQDAQKHAYKAVKVIHWGYEFYRSDIGAKAIK